MQLPLSISHAAAEDPERIALVMGGEAHTYATLADGAGRIAGWLERRGRPSRVALVPRLDIPTICTLLALIESGTTAVLLHPRLTNRERAVLVRDAAPDLVLEDVAGDVAEARQCAPARTPAGRHDPESCLAMLYTSGTTGTPKGAMLARRAFLASAEASAANLGWHPDDRWLLCMPLAHVGGLSILVRSLIARRCVVIPEVDRFDPELIRHVIERDRVTIASFVPTMLKRVLDAESSRPLPSHLRAVLLGGAAAPSSLLDTSRELKLPVLTTYGLTEACSQVTTQQYGTPPGSDQGSGRAIAGVDIRIVDDRIEVRGPTLMTKYHGLESPFLADGWLRTEDFGRIDESGRLHVLGRRQELLVTGGENVYPLEVERELESIPGLDAACVFGSPDETWGEIVCAALVLRSGGDSSSIAHEIHARLASHKRPRRIAVLTELPATAAGKLDRFGAARVATPLLVPLESLRG